MSRTNFWLTLLLVPCGLFFAACGAKATTPETTDPVEAAKDPDFKIQGEYVGEGIWADGEKTKVGAQVIAQGHGKFAVVVTKGGLPGDGWRRGGPRFSLIGERRGGAVELVGALAAPGGAGKTTLSGKIAGETAIVGDGGKIKLELKRIKRHSPTEGTKPPKGAVVLFNGTTADAFHDGTLLPDKNLLSNATSKRAFGDYTLHIEFRLSYMPEAQGQARSNSGVYLHDCYEIQVLDSFGLEGENNECGGFYSIRRPDVNMCYPPLAWQTYDIDFIAPKYEGGKKTADARIEVRHNGVVIHATMKLPHATPGRQDEGPAPRPIYLQGHGNKVEYRNIWVKEK